jgi:hypothetical protein
MPVDQAPDRPARVATVVTNFGEQMTHERRTIPMARQATPSGECPFAPPEHASVYAKSLHRACLILGGMDALARQLQVPRELLERWIRGEGEPTQRVFHECVEIILLYLAKAGPAV